jgi:[ribosomal protein S5]-alanine N-acetyltransferase
MSSPAPGPVPTLSALPLEIATARLRLRPVAETDVEALWPFVSDPALPRQMIWEAHRDRAETLRFLERQRDELVGGTGVTWAIEHEGSVIGLIALSNITWQLLALRIDRAELGYWLGPPSWGRGLASEAARAATKWGFEALGLHKITIGCAEANARSRRVIEKLGFRFLALAQEDFWRDGRWQDVGRYELTAAEWSERAQVSSLLQGRSR